MLHSQTTARITYGHSSSSYGRFTCKIIPRGAQQRFSGTGAYVALLSRAAAGTTSSFTCCLPCHWLPDREALLQQGTLQEINTLLLQHAKACEWFYALGCWQRELSSRGDFPQSRKMLPPASPPRQRVLELLPPEHTYPGGIGCQNQPTRPALPVVT